MRLLHLVSLLDALYISNVSATVEQLKSKALRALHHHAVGLLQIIVIGSLIQRRKEAH